MPAPRLSPLQALPLLQALPPLQLLRMFRVEFDSFSPVH